MSGGWPPHVDRRPDDHYACGPPDHRIYGRHSFEYEVPASEDAAGTTIYMRLANEETVYLWAGAQSGDPEVWKRCEPIAAIRRPLSRFG